MCHSIAVYFLFLKKKIGRLDLLETVLCYVKIHKQLGAICSCEWVRNWIKNLIFRWRHLKYTCSVKLAVNRCAIESKISFLDVDIKDTASRMNHLVVLTVNVRLRGHLNNLHCIIILNECCIGNEIALWNFEWYVSSEWTFYGYFVEIFVLAESKTVIFDCSLVFWHVC